MCCHLLLSFLSLTFTAALRLNKLSHQPLPPSEFTDEVGKIQEEPFTFNATDMTYNESCGNRRNYRCWRKGGHSTGAGVHAPGGCTLATGDPTNIFNQGIANAGFSLYKAWTTIQKGGVDRQLTGVGINILNENNPAPVYLKVYGEILANGSPEHPSLNAKDLFVGITPLYRTKNVTISQTSFPEKAIFDLSTDENGVPQNNAGKYDQLYVEFNGYSGNPGIEYMFSLINGVTCLQGYNAYPGHCTGGTNVGFWGSMAYTSYGHECT